MSDWGLGRVRLVVQLKAGGRIDDFRIKRMVNKR
jgi:hypothetical protein